MAKDIRFGEEARRGMEAGINKLSDVMKFVLIGDLKHLQDK